MARCLIGCGSNLGRRREQLDRGLELLGFMPGIDLVSVSRYVETRPVGGPAGQGGFLNGACLVETDLPPAELLGALVAVENTLQRSRSARWGERTIDLDLLLYDELMLESPELTLPHPRMATRRFVLEPAAEIAAELPYPPGCCTVGDLLENISVPRPLVAVVGVPGSGAPEVATAVADATLARLLPMPVPLPGAAVEIEAREGAGFERFFDRLAAAAVTPQVAILLRVGAEELRERIAFRSRTAGRFCDVFADLDAVTVASPSEVESQALDLLRLQDRLERRLRCPPERCPRAPKAVIVVEADDMAAASAEAIAAVEAMA